MNYDKKFNGLKNIVLITQLGLSFMVPVFLMLILGMKLEKYIGKTGLIFLVIIGFVSGGYAVFSQLKSSLKPSDKELEKKEEEEYIKNVLEQMEESRLDRDDRRDSK